MTVFAAGRRHWLNIVIMAVLIAFFIAFALSNLSPIEVSLLGVHSSPIAYYIPVFIAFIVGFSAGMLALSFSRRKHKREIVNLREQNKRLNQEVENLRNIPLQDDV